MLALVSPGKTVRKKRSTPAPTLSDALGSVSSSAEAGRFASKMPLVNYPAFYPVDEWLQWPALRSKRDLGQPPPRTKLERLHWEHVFAYAGPCCYMHRDAHGDAAMYFLPAIEGGRSGAACPFDTGSVEKGRLRPVVPPRRRMGFVERHSVDLSAWRQTFSRWLTHCYSFPDRYFETTGDRYRDGAPERTIPDALCQENGEPGRRLHGKDACADRRAWTWEVRVVESIPFAEGRLLHVPFQKLRRAHDFKKRYGLRCEIRTLPRHDPAGPDSLYRHSGIVIRDMVT